MSPLTREALSAALAAREARPPKWSARLELDGEELACEPSRWDTLAETRASAEAEAREYLAAGLAREARVLLYKQLAGWEQPRFDRCTTYYWLDERGRIFRSRG